MGIEHTSVPRWDPIAPAVPAGARSITVLGLGPAAEDTVRAWADAARHTGADVRVLRAPSARDAAPLLTAEMAGAVVGWRLLLAGPEADVLRVRSQALDLGAVPAEVLAHVTGTPLRRVLCAHCATETETDAPVDGTCTCAGCRRTLHVYHHVSRRLGAYLGYMIDAEEHDPAPLPGARR